MTYRMLVRPPTQHGSLPLVLACECGDTLDLGAMPLLDDLNATAELHRRLKHPDRADFPEARPALPVRSTVSSAQLRLHAAGGNHPFRPPAPGAGASGYACEVCGHSPAHPMHLGPR